MSPPRWVRTPRESRLYTDALTIVVYHSDIGWEFYSSYGAGTGYGGGEGTYRTRRAGERGAIKEILADTNAIRRPLLALRKAG